MRIEKVINNNVISALDDQGREIVAMGRGCLLYTSADAAVPTKEQLQLLQALQNGSLSEEQLLSLRETITDQLGRCV